MTLLGAAAAAAWEWRVVGEKTYGRVSTAAPGVTNTGVGVGCKVWAGRWEGIAPFYSISSSSSSIIENNGEAVWRGGWSNPPLWATVHTARIVMTSKIYLWDSWESFPCHREVWRLHTHRVHPQLGSGLATSLHKAINQKTQANSCQWPCCDYFAVTSAHFKNTETYQICIIFALNHQHYLYFSSHTTIFCSLYNNATGYIIVPLWRWW